MLFHLLDVLAHDFIVEAEDDTTVQGHYEYNKPEADSDGEFEEDARPRAAKRETRREFTIELFGVTAEGKPVHTKVSGFQPYFYLELPVTVSAESIKSDLCRRLERYVPSVRQFITFEKVKRSLLFGYTANRQFPMVKISVSSLDLFRKLKDIVLTKKLQPTYKPFGCTKPLEVYEANLDPMLRFFHLQTLEPCGWVEADCEFEQGEAGRLQGECHWTDVTAPKKKPATSGSALIASWDIECYSPDGDFPVPEKRQYPIIQIGVVLVRPGGTPDRHCFVLDTCSPVQDVTIHVSKTEKDLLLDWSAHMCQWDPDMLIGYNIFGFDERYVWKRAELLGIEASAGFQGFSRFEGQEVKLQEKMLSSSALGDNKLYILTTPGRLQIDLYHYIKRQEALPSYKLDDVTSHYMSGKLKGIRQTEGLVHLKTTVTKDVRIGRSIKILDETGEPVAEKCVVVSAAGGEIVVQTDEPLDDTDLALAKKWAIVKDDVPPAEIFRLHREGGAEGRAKVADYCVQDCNLVLELFNKLDVFNNAMSMANVCSVPVNYIFTRGQGIKIESLIFRECALRGQIVKVLDAPTNNSFNKKPGDPDEEEPEEESYEGAIVFPPKPDFYFDSPVGVCDFASLYPSSIISENISYDTLVWVRDVKPDGSWVYSYGGEPAVVEPGVQFTDIEFDILRPDPNDTRKHPEKIKDGLRICRYAQLGNTKGTLPAILQMLLASRKAKRKQAEKETDPFVKALLDAEQLAYKLTANSLYGQLGSPTFKIRLQALAASTTAYGRKQITFAKEAIAEFYGPKSGRKDCCAEGAQLVYGDSVTGDTPIYCRISEGEPFLSRMDELVGSWSPWHETKEHMVVEGLQVWTERGWTAVKHVMRHRLAPSKKMWRILTHTGVVDCTEDHSLVGADGKEVKPGDVQVGTALLHNNEVAEEFGGAATSEAPTAKEAWAMGFFLADGSTDVYTCPSGVKATWAINKADIGLLEKAATCLPFETKILDTLESSGVYKLVAHGAVKEQAVKYRQLFYNAHREKRVPPCILNAPLPVIEEFMAGFYAGDGDKANGHGYVRWDQKGKEVCTGLYILSRRLGYSVSLNDRASKQDVFRLTLTKRTQRKATNVIKKKWQIDTEGIEYVYDLETENHHFAVGPGELVVHNTDSLFVNFNPCNPETGERLTGREAVQRTIELTTECGKFITAGLKAPHDFEYDKTFWPFIIFSKKRYVGNKYEESADEFKQNYMGIVLKRRDNAPIVKTIYGGAINILLNQRNVPAAAEFVRQKCAELVSGKVSLGQLTITKSLRANYANPTRIAHKVLADRIAARDPGNAPASGDRIPYVYITKPDAVLQGDRIEMPSYVREHGLRPDIPFYIEHQLSSPLAQLFSLRVEEVPGFPGKPSGWSPDDDQRAAEREKMAMQLLFQESLKMFEAPARRAAIERMGFTVLEKEGAAAGAAAGRVVSVEPVPQKKQVVLSSYWAGRIEEAVFKKSKKEQGKNGAKPK